MRRPADEEAGEHIGQSVPTRRIMRAMPKHAESTAVAPEKVVRVVTHALTARRPHARYVVGLEAHLLINFFSLAPTRLGDRLMRSGFDLMARFV